MEILLIIVVTLIVFWKVLIKVRDLMFKVLEVGVDETADYLDIATAHSKATKDSLKVSAVEKLLKTNEKLETIDTSKLTTNTEKMSAINDFLSGKGVSNEQ